MNLGLITPCYIGLGSNLDHPQRHLVDALIDLEAIPHSQLIGFSSLYSSRPMGPQDQQSYVNAVAQLDTRLAPDELLSELQTIELAHGRERKQEQWGPRTLDLDILLYGNKTINNQRLSVPHPGISKREFVLYPLHELDKNLMIPNLGRVYRIKPRCYRNGLVQLNH